LGRDLPDATACARHDKETKDGEDMRYAQQLLARQLLQSSARVKSAPSPACLRPGGTHAMKGEFAGSNDFEVVAFLVVLPEAIA
jgi:hypothetical protein